MSIFNMDMTQQIIDSIRSSVSSFCKSLDGTVAGMNVGVTFIRRLPWPFKRPQSGPLAT